MPLMFDDRFENEEEPKKKRIKRKASEPLEVPRRYIVKRGAETVESATPDTSSDYRLMGTHETLAEARRRLGW